MGVIQMLIDNIMTDLNQLITRISQEHFAEVINAFQLASGSTGSLQAFWVQLAGQTAVLVLLVALLLSAANRSTPLLSSIQQSLLKQIEDPRVKRIAIELLWILKPNIPWILILSGSYGLMQLTPTSWFMLRLIGPIGLVYAIFRGTRVIIEWVLNRTHTRGGQFISNLLAEELSKVSFSFSIQCGLTLICFKFFSYTDFLVYLIGLTLFGGLWFRLTGIARQYPYLIEKKFRLNASKKNKKQPNKLGAFIFELLAPALFFLAFLLDLLDQLHHRLMVLDSYRLLHTKLIRAQLERKSESQKEDIDTEKTNSSYASHMRKTPDSKSLVPQKEFLQRVLQPIESWQKQHTEDNVLLLVADQGMGKTTLLNQIEETCHSTKLIRIDIQEKILTASGFFRLLAKALDASQITEITDIVDHDASIMKPTIITIDNAHNLFLSEVGCFEAYKCLLNCVNAHLEHIFWVISIHSSSWAYLKQAFSREQKFADELYLPRWSAQDIRKLIMNRHQNSHRRMSFNELLFSASASSETSSIRSADSRVFNILWEQSNGNPEIAIALWLKAVKVEGFRLEVGVPQCPASTPLKALSDDLCFVYSAIMIHRFLSTKEIIQVTHLAEPIVRHSVKQGVNMGLIQRSEQGRYEICITWYATLYQFLLSKNMLISP